MQKNFILALSMMVAVFCCPGALFADRLKDIADIEGVRGNELVGYGVVVGLNGSGDKKGTAFTSQSMSNLLERLGVRVDAKDLALSNTAGVVVTATLPPFARPGMKVDVTLSSIGDAATIQGGVLLMTPLRGADGKVYAVAQGPVSIGGFVVAGGGDSAQKNHPTVGRVANGASIEKAVPFDLFASGRLRVVLKEPDFTTATRVEEAINTVLGAGVARAVDSTSILMPISEQDAGSPIHLISQLEELDVRPDAPARVVVNERTGTIVMGENVRVSTVALAHGGLNITIRKDDQVSQPNALAQGQTVVARQTDIKVGEEGGLLNMVEEQVSLGEVVRALNSLGASPRDLIAIFQALKRAGALRADLVIM